MFYCSFFFFSSRRRHTRFSRDWSSDVCSSDLGHSISNSGAYVMDASQKLVPAGVMGELILTGDGLARGYTNPALRSEERRVGKECRCRSSCFSQKQVRIEAAPLRPLPVTIRAS